MRPRLGALAPVFAVAMMLVVSPSGAKDRAAKAAEEDMAFGFKVARKGYWQEALERFEQADRATPNQPRILNNIAVALEANGRFDEAREVYTRALALDPSNSAAQRNYQRFEEFYDAFVAVEETEPGAAPAAGEEADDDG